MPGTGFATGNCALAAFAPVGEGFVLLPAVRGVALAVDRLPLREATRAAGVGEGTATGWPGFATSDVFAAGVDSGLWKTSRTGAVITRPIPQPTNATATTVAARGRQFIASL